MVALVTGKYASEQIFRDAFYASCFSSRNCFYSLPEVANETGSCPTPLTPLRHPDERLYLALSLQQLVTAIALVDPRSSFIMTVWKFKQGCVGSEGFSAFCVAHHFKKMQNRDHSWVSKNIAFPHLRTANSYLQIGPCCALKSYMWMKKTLNILCFKCSS